MFEPLLGRNKAHRLMQNLPGSKCRLSTFFFINVQYLSFGFLPQKKKVCIAREEEGCGKGSAGINYLQANLLFQRRTEKASVPAPPVIRLVFFFFLLCLLFLVWRIFSSHFPYSPTNFICRSLFALATSF